MLYSVDRIEGTLAVLVDEDEESLCVPLTELPPVCEGDMVRHTDAGYVFDEEATRQRREEILALQERLNG